MNKHRTHKNVKTAFLVVVSVQVLMVVWMSISMVVSVMAALNVTSGRIWINFSILTNHFHPLLVLNGSEGGGALDTANPTYAMSVEVAP